jgi:hypothetical protein
MSFKVILLPIFFILYGFLPKDDVEIIFDTVEKKYNQMSYFSYTSTYNVYEENNRTKSIEKTTGLFLKKNKVSYQKVESNEIIDFGDYTFIADHENKLVSISKKDQETQFITLKSLLPLFKNRELLIKGENKICVLKAGKLNQLPYDKVEVHIDKKTNELKKQLFYFSGKKEYKQKGRKVIALNPVLEVSYSVRPKNDAKDNQLIAKTNYFSMQKNKIVLANKYKNYKLIN